MSFNKKILTIFGIHTINEQKYYATLNNIKHLHKYSNKIICIDSIINKSSGLKENILNLYDNVDFYYIKNNPILLDVSKWMYGLDKESYLEYDFVILVNDSICISRPITDFIKMIYRNNAEMYGIIDSFENNYHFQSFLRAFNKNGINKFIRYYYSNYQKIQTPYQTIITIEVEITTIFTQIDSLFTIKNILNRTTKLNKLKSEIKFYYYYIFDMDKRYLRTRKISNLHFNERIYKYFLFTLNYPIIKLKKVNSYFYPMNYKLDEKDFNPIVYKNMHWDLCSISTNDLKKHFYQCGIREGRKYKPTQDSNPPNYLVEYITNNSLDFLLS